MRPIKFNVGLPNGDPAATLAAARRAEVTYFFLNFMMPETIEMFAKEVMPAFAR